MADSALLVAVGGELAGEMSPGGERESMLSMPLSLARSLLWILLTWASRGVGGGGGGGCGGCGGLGAAVVAAGRQIWALCLSSKEMPPLLV